MTNSVGCESGRQFLYRKFPQPKSVSQFPNL